MGKTWNAPAACADCAEDAYIRMGDDGSVEMLCAHCYAKRIRTAKPPPETAHRRPAPVPTARPQ